MEFKTFIDEVAAIIRIKMCDKAVVTVKKITKNNNIVLDGITIRLDNETISPTIYLNHYYQEYLEGKSIENIALDIIALYQANKVNKNVDINFFVNFENVKDKIAFKLINYEKNIEILKDIPHIQFMDLAIVFYYLVRSDLFGNATILIHNSHVNMWHTNTYEIYKAAQINTQKLLGIEIENIETIIKEELGGNIDEIISEEVENPIPMYVISNKMKLYGASCVLYQNVLKDFSERMDSDLYILPSSVHELIVIPKNGESESNDLKKIVQETNDNHVDEEEILSYSVYEYVRNKDKLQILA